MDLLPAEIKRIIAFNLLSDEPADGGIVDIKQLRLVNRAYAIVAAETLFSEIYLMFKSESFERMRTVSAHPSFAKFVKSIRHEPDRLDHYSDFWDWVNRSPSARPSLSGIHRPAQPCKDEGKEGVTRYQKKLREYKLRLKAATQWLRPQYNVYQTAFQDQKTICQQGHDPDPGALTEAMAQLPKLEQVTLEYPRRIMRQMNVLTISSPVTREIQRELKSDGKSHGVMQLRSILLGAHDADTKLKVLTCGNIDWRFFQLPEMDMDIMKPALKHLTYLHISIYTGPKNMAAQCHTFLKNHRMCQFLSAAKNLRSLNIQFDQFQCVELKYCIGQNIWIHLSTVQLGYLNTNEDALISFLGRHAGTLEDLTLCEINLVQGDWISALSRVRDTVKLTKFRASNALTSANPRPEGQHWCIDCDIYLAFSESSVKIERSQQLATEIEEYVLDGGDCPLLDYVTYPQRLLCSRY